MKFDFLKKNIGYRVQLEPPAIHLDKHGRELPAHNEDWNLQTVTDTEIRIETAEGLSMTAVLGLDHVHHFTSNPARSVEGGQKYGFLSLHVQLFIQNGALSYRPCSRPGERVEPLTTPIHKKWVEISYPMKSGLQSKLETSGHRARWCRESRLATLELEGWEVVIENDNHGMPTSFHSRDNPEDQVYVKAHDTDLRMSERTSSAKTDAIKSPAADRDYIAIGNDVVFTGELIRFDGTEWQFRIDDFIVGGLATLINLCDRFDQMRSNERFVLVTSLGEGWS